MAASDEFPRGIVLTSATSGISAASVTFPAPNPGPLGTPLSWVITDVQATLISTSTVGSFSTSVIDTQTNGRQFILLVVGINTANGADTASGSWSGKLIYPAGQLVTIAFAGTFASTSQNLQVTGYPI